MGASCSRAHARAVEYVPENLETLRSLTDAKILQKGDIGLAVDPAEYITLGRGYPSLAFEVPEMLRGHPQKLCGLSDVPCLSVHMASVVPGLELRYRLSWG